MRYDFPAFKFDSQGEEMRLTPKEQEKFLLYYAGEVARKRKAEGLKLNQPEAIAYVSAHIMDEARRGKKNGCGFDARVHALFEKR